MTLRTKPRRGYAMVTVLVFLAVMLTILSITQRQMISLLRQQQVQHSIDTFEQSAGQALARGVELLETGLPPSNRYTCRTLVATPQGSQSFTVTYTKEKGKRWQVQVAPTSPAENPPLMPATFYGR